MKILSIQNPFLSQRPNLHNFCQNILKTEHDLLLLSGNIVKCTESFMLQRFRNIYKKKFYFVTGPLFYHYWSIGEARNYLSREFSEEYLTPQNSVFLGVKKNEKVFLTGSDGLGYEKSSHYKNSHKENLKRINDFRGIKYEKSQDILLNIREQEIKVLEHKFFTNYGLHILLTNSSLQQCFQHPKITNIKSDFTIKKSIVFSGDIDCDLYEI